MILIDIQMTNMTKKTEIMNRLDAHDFTPEEQKRWDKLGENCTSGCGNDFDCPHEEALYAELLQDALAMTQHND